MQDRGTRGGSRPIGLVGRRDEQEALDGLLDGARSGRGGVLVLRGEAGVGKTALLEYVAERASGCELARATGVQAEMELAFAGLQQMFASLLGPLERLPDPQREALAVAFGLRRPHRHWLVSVPHAAVPTMQVLSRDAYTSLSGPRDDGLLTCR